MQEFLTFEKFITQDILIFIYYLGVISLPIFLWVYREKTLQIISKIEKSNLLILFGIIVLMEIMWRMMFEAMIGYFDMHNYLQILVERSFTE